jgi:NifU-like protein
MSYEIKGYEQSKGWLYTDSVKDHFFNPRNLFKTTEEVKKYEKEADGIGEVGSPACGDVMKMFIKVKDGKIKECKWQTFGCASAIASTSMLSVMVIGKTIEEAKKITPKDIVNKLGGLPPRKIHCSVLGDKALRAAIDNYEKKNEHK